MTTNINICPHRSFLKKSKPPALSGSGQFIKGFPRDILAPFMGNLIHKDAGLPTGFQVRLVKHPLSSGHRSQIFLIPNI